MDLGSGSGKWLANEADFAYQIQQHLEEMNIKRQLDPKVDDASEFLATIAMTGKLLC